MQVKRVFRMVWLWYVWTPFFWFWLIWKGYKMLQVHVKYLQISELSGIFTRGVKEWSCRKLTQCMAYVACSLFLRVHKGCLHLLCATYVPHHVVQMIHSLCRQASACCWCLQGVFMSRKIYCEDNYWVKVSSKRLLGLMCRLCGFTDLLCFHSQHEV